MMKRISLWCLVIGLLTPLAASSAAPAARVQEIRINNTRDDLLVYFSVAQAFQEKIKAAIFSGVPVSFVFRVRLYESRNMWADSNIASVTVTHTVKYDNLKKEFSVQRSWQKETPRVTRAFEEAAKWMTEVDSLKVIPLGRLQKGQRYQIRIKAELSKMTLPFYLHYVLFFVSLWDVETDWNTVDFIY